MNKKEKFDIIVVDSRDSEYLVELEMLPGVTSMGFYSKKPYEIIQAGVDELLGYPEGVPIGIGDLCLYCADGIFYVLTPDQETEKEEYNRVKPLVIEWFKKFYVEHKEVFHKEIKLYLEENKEYMEEELANGAPCWEDKE